jgi:outer membrane protein OmpA-like peptidoglycan-associated protein
MAYRLLSRLPSPSKGLLAMVFAAITLAGCVNETALDQLADAEPTGTPFAQALFKNYAYLARSFGSVGAAAGTSFNQEGSMSLASVDSSVGALADAFAAKALLAARGIDVEPEPGADGITHTMRDRLVRALNSGRDTFPIDAARAQVDYDCWRLNGTVDSQAAAAEQCHRSLDVTLAKLERDLHPGAAPPPMSSAAPESSAAPAMVASAPSADYTVYFDFDSWTLTAQDLNVLTQAIAAARAGGQSRIAIVGHTDTAGSAEYNQKLSERRAGIVRDTLVDMGARKDAIQVSGVGESDLAVQTGDGVREPKNRRAVVTLTM